VAAVAGTATFTNLSINRVGTGYTLIGSSAGVTSTPASTAFNISAGPAFRFVIITAPFTRARNVVSPQITVQLQDNFGNAVANTVARTVFFASSSTGGKFRLTAGGSAVTSTSMPNGTNSVNFFYIDSKKNNPTIRAKDQSGTTDTGMVDATQVESIT
jgi:hypothetical protein